MNDRDHFAAAALTGLLSDKANRYPTALQWEHLLKHAYRWADAMLRERERTDNQTAPPCVETDGPSSAIAQPPASSDGSGEGRPRDVTRPDNGEAAGGRGRNTQEPVAWIVHSGDLRWFAWAKPADGLYDGPIIPLYRTPQTCPYVVGRTTQHCSLTPFTLTAEEREAIREACDEGRWYPKDYHRIYTLRSLLKRTK